MMLREKQTWKPAVRQSRVTSGYIYKQHALNPNSGRILVDGAWPGEKM
jgi:hypothetical protein